MRIAVIATGSELMRGRAVDTHLGHFARRLETVGHKVLYHATCGDALDRVVDEIKLAAARADVVILSGGLGPTQDDLTREAAAEAFHRPLVFHADAWREIRARFRRFKIPLAAINRRQAFAPEGARLLPNPNGSAPGFALVADGVRFFALPGPPREMMPMFDRLVLPRIPGARAVPVWEARTTGLPEGTLDEIVEPIVKRFKRARYGTTVAHGTVNMSIVGADAMRAGRSVAKALGRNVFFRPLEEEVAALLMKRRVTIAIAESCTGGLVAHKLTQVAGVSAVLLEACVTYSNESKIARLGVPAEVIARHGAVSEECARAMAEGAARTGGAALGVATTGIAGPTGGSKAKPVGLVWHAVAYRGETRAVARVFPGERAHVKERAANLALDLVRRAVL
jgi:nicotinamide-nucleotide amidase